MNWEAVGAIGEIVGAFAVIVTLIYLATQVRYAKKATADQNRLLRATGVREVALAAATNEIFRQTMDRNWVGDKIYEKIAEETGDSPAEVSRADWGNAYWFWLHWGQYSSTHEEGDLRELKNVIAGFYSLPGVRRSWETSPHAKPIMDPEFIKFVDEILAQNDRANDT